VPAHAAEKTQALQFILQHSLATGVPGRSQQQAVNLLRIVQQAGVDQ
jgi:hypothetical protein